MKHCIRQTELAELLGVEQSYISALEIGTKGPPPAEFLSKLGDVLDLSQGERDDLHSRAEASRRRFELDAESSQSTYWLLHELWQQVNDLHPVQIKLIRDALKLKGSLVPCDPEPLRRIKRRRKEEARM
jgi:transcriptional regulator with XRE-family HTH domain